MQSTFIFELFQDSSGKTVLASGLARGLLSRGVNVGVFKPRSGHNMWHQYGAFLKCKASGSLFCEDIIKLREASKCSLPYEVLNPVDALLSPFNAEAFLERGLTGQMYLFEQDAFSHLIVERHTLYRDEEFANVLLVNERNISTDIVMLNNDYIRELKRKACQIIPVHSMDEWASTSTQLGSKAICSCYTPVKQECTNLIIESFNDSVCPELEIIRDVEVVIGAAPGTAIFYNSDEFKRILEAMVKLGRNPTTLRSEHVIKFVRKYKTFKIPPLPTEDLTDYDKISRKLEGVVDYLIQLHPTRNRRFRRGSLSVKSTTTQKLVLLMGSFILCLVFPLTTSAYHPLKLEFPFAT